MPVAGFNIGRDVTVDLIGQNGSLITFAGVTEFEAKPINKELTSSRLDGVNLFATIPAGWEGTVTLDRADSNLDDYIAQIEALYYAGQTIAYGQITETISEVSGAITQYRYTNVAYNLEDAGTWKGDDKVVEKLKFKASQKIKVL